MWGGLEEVALSSPSSRPEQYQTVANSKSIRALGAASTGVCMIEINM